MPNLNQAPELVYNGNKDQKSKGWGKAIRTHELESAIMCGLGDRDFAMMKIMLFLTGNAPGFLIAEKTICDRCNISEVGYKKARKKLIDMGWLSLKDSKIIVNFDNIMKGYTGDTSISVKDNQNIIDKKQGYTGDTSKRYTGFTPQGYTGDTYNNISNSINNNINNTGQPQTSSASLKDTKIPKEKENKIDISKLPIVKKEEVISAVEGKYIKQDKLEVVYDTIKQKMYRIV